MTLAERHEAALAQRRVYVEPAADGMAWTHQFMPAVEAHASYQRATAMAKEILAQDGETRTLDQIRADVMADLLIEGTTTAHPSEARGIRASVVVTVPALALLEVDDARWPNRVPTRRRSRVSDRSRSRRHANCAEETRRGCGCSPTPRRASSSPSGARNTRRPHRSSAS